MFDLRALIPPAPAEGQINEGGANARANCVPAAHLYCLKCLGYGDPLEPQDVAGLIVAGGFSPGGFTFAQVVNAIASQEARYPAPLPAMQIEAPADLEAALEAAGEAGRPVCVALQVSDAQVFPVPRGSAASSGHCEIVTAHLAGDWWVLWNPWSGEYDTISGSLLTAAYIGGITIFEGTTMIDATTLARLQAYLSAAAGGPGQGGGADYSGLRFWWAGGGQYDPAHPEQSPNARMLAALEGTGLAAVSAELAVIKAELDTLTAHSDPAVAAAAARLEGALKAAGVALGGA